MLNGQSSIWDVLPRRMGEPSRDSSLVRRKKVLPSCSWEGLLIVRQETTRDTKVCLGSCGRWEMQISLNN